MKKILLALALINCLLIFSQKNPKLNNGKELIRLMHQTYKNKWHNNLTFTQKTTFYKNGKPDREETWYEAMKMPKGLVIKFGSMDSGNGISFKNDSIISFKDGKMVHKTKKVHDLLLLGFSIYFEEPELTIKKLEDSGFDLNECQTEIIYGTLYYVVGNSKQKRFWVDAKRLFFYKVQELHKGGTVLITEFNNYRKLGKGWIAPEVVFYRDGEIVMKEEYNDIRTDIKLDYQIFDEINFSAIKW